jgi:transcriptional regulator with XRE-family HTH domain
MYFPEDMRDKDYRHGLVSAQIDIDLPFQIRALRKQRHLTQPEFAGLAEMRQPRISKMEQPGEAHFTLETLRRLARALDVALIVRFAPFSELLRRSEEFNPDTFSVLGFEEEMQLPDRIAPSVASAPLYSSLPDETKTVYRQHAEDASRIDNVIFFPADLGQANPETNYRKFASTT